MIFPFVAENTASRQKLEAFVSTLTEDELQLVSPSGWTVAGLLAHLAYWDQRVLALLRRWQAGGVDESPVDSAAINDALKPLCHALEPRAAVDLCLDSAQACDSELESISSELVAAIEASPNHFRFNRSMHRLDHLDEIAKVIGKTI